MRLLSVNGWARLFSSARGLLSARRWHRWMMAGCVAACMTSTGAAQIACDSTSCDCEGCQAFLSQCDALPAPGYMTPGYMTPAPVVPPSTQPAPVVPSTPSDSFGSGVTPQDSVVAPPARQQTNSALMYSNRQPRHP